MNPIQNHINRCYEACKNHINRGYEAYQNRINQLKEIRDYER